VKRIILILSIIASISVGNTTPINIHARTRVDSVYICVSATGHKYHDNRDCHGLARCTHEIRKVSKAQAIKMGYSACKICYK